MAAGDGDVKLSTLGSGEERGGDGSPGGAGATAARSSWVAALLATGGEMLLNVALVALVLLGAYRLWVRWGRRGLCSGPGAGEESPAATLPRMKKRDFSLEQLRQYDGARTPRILLAVNGKVFDVTKGSKFYGPAGPYGIFAGRDASRGLATFCLDKDALRDEYDDLSDLNAVQMESVREWEMQFKEKYDYVGRLLKPGEEPSEYTDEEDTKDHSKQD
ncbi:membrane-associated progesterone receptor component 2 isoform X3 [Apodemus sylvaticus]|uniref:membrane-associated progesterone receptor component 2 isoform X1 n=1 Tax=Apodemus sylvaticus TaxID=10129 RepID=UPI0022443DAD|nr:membrane-associated progesterone receptor component 2 isoform X1 [Apodemus sylvaticus]XP_052036535.1 membrane-associated progesterone receptor component 2 isoform X2 [Apodemus sylvaticus]XP_052036536.1 membrane-associated progesterone receptor component 2 isoform X3 [Apodemus sylvaticus]